ncbi:MAG TPA: S53 family peptidase [Gaiellales bacterium]|jgi:kumamolisin
MPSSGLVEIQGSNREPVPGAEQVGGLDHGQTMQITVVMNRRSEAAPQAPSRPDAGTDIATWRSQLRDQLAHEHGPDEAEANAVSGYLQGHNLDVEQTGDGRRDMIVTGTVAQMEDAFGVSLDTYRAGDTSYRGRTGPVHMPQDIADSVQAVLGLDNRPQARAHMKRGDTVDESQVTDPARDPFELLPDADIQGMRAAAAPKPTPLWPMQVAQLYDFPTTPTGRGETIGIIELEGGYRTSDLKAYFAKAKISPAPKVIAVGTNTPGANPDADGEVGLDIEVAGAVAPGAKIVVYFGDNSDNVFYDTLAAAVHDETNSPSVISISWGAPEDAWSKQARTAFDALLADAHALGITVFVAAGDHGAGDAGGNSAVHADFPASSPHAVGCGGTTLVGASAGIVSEVAWNDGDGWATGGGISLDFPRPAWQPTTLPHNLTHPTRTGRGVPDVAGNADIKSGFWTLIDGQWAPVGGTSAVAPLYAGLMARINQSIGAPATGLPEALYAVPQTAFRDITAGDNSVPSSQYGPAVAGYSAGDGWDACTGLGSIVGSALSAALPATMAAMAKTA